MDGLGKDIFISYFVWGCYSVNFKTQIHFTFSDDTLLLEGRGSDNLKSLTNNN